MTDGKGMTKTEREELRRVVRQDFKVLAEEITVRQAEMAADIDEQVARRFLPQDTAVAQCRRDIARIVTDANEAIAAAVDAMMADADGYECEWHKLQPPYVRVHEQKREQMRRAAHSGLNAKVAAAKARIHREEANLLKQLAVGALESEAAQAFLASIPSVAELVPAARLAELEAQFTRNDE